MKTNKMMTVVFANGAINIEHKTSMGNLGDVFAVGNKYRAAEGKNRANITHFVRSGATQEFLDSVAKRLGVSKESLLYTKGKGKNPRIVANLFIIVYAAEYLSSNFHVEVIDTFINANILSWRDKSGDAFKGLNAELSTHIERMLDKPAHNGHFITLAKIVNSRIGNVLDLNIADASQLKERERIETALTTIIKLGLVKDWEHLKQIAAEV
jgi:hypothetical protein